MYKSWFEFDRKNTSKGIYDKLKSNEKEIIDKFEDYLLIGASPIRAKEGIREVLRFQAITGVSLILLKNSLHS